MQKIRAWGAPAAGRRLGPMTIERRPPGAHDIVINILCGVCHSDIHQARDEWSGGSPWSRATESSAVSWASAARSRS